MSKVGAQHIVVGEVPASEYAYRNACAGGGIDLLALHGVKQRFARILGSPYCRQTGGKRLIMTYRNVRPIGLLEDAGDLVNAPAAGSAATGLSRA